MKQPWRIWVNIAHEPLGAHDITTIIIIVIIIIVIIIKYDNDNWRI